MPLLSIDSDEYHPSNTTAIVGVTYNDGIILGSTDTITQLTANIFSCHCASEIETLLEDASNFILDQESTMVTTETICTMLSAYNNGMKNILQTGVIIGGGKKIYEISLGGVVLEKSDFGVGGYGAPYLNNFLEKEWKNGMNEEEAEELVLKTLSIIFLLSGVRSCGIQTASVNSKDITRAFHPHDTLPIRQEKLDLEHVIGGKALLECVHACSSMS